MKQIEIKTMTKIEVSINGESVDAFLSEICELAHRALIELSIYRQEHGMKEDELENIEGDFCKLLDKLGD